MDDVLRALAIPDIMVEWLPFAFLKGQKLLRENCYDLILSAGLPFTAHVLGYVLKRLHKLPWVAEYGDPWAFNPTSRLPRWRYSLDRRLEGNLLLLADGIVTTTENIRQAYLRNYSFLQPDKVCVVPSGYSPDEYAKLPAATSTRFRIVYTGIFYSNVRSPRAFFDALTHLRDLDMEVVIAGPTDGQLCETIRTAGLHHQVQLLGNVPNSQAIALQKGSSLLLLIGNTTSSCATYKSGAAASAFNNNMTDGHGVSYGLPLKTWEYLGAKRPILCIRNGENDLVAALVEPLRRGIVVDNKPECIASAIRTAYDLWKCGQLDSQFQLGDLDEFTWSNAGAKLHAVLSSLSSRDVGVQSSSV